MKAIILLDGKTFSGIDPDADWPMPVPAFRPGFHHYPGNGHLRDVLCFGSEAHVIEDRRSLAGYVTDIIYALHEGFVIGKTITIELLEI